MRVITHERDSRFVKKKIHMGRWNSPNSWLPCRYLSRIFMQFWTRKKNNSTKEVNRLIGDLWISLDEEFSPRKEGTAGAQEEEVLQRYNRHIIWDPHTTKGNTVGWQRLFL